MIKGSNVVPSDVRSLVHSPSRAIQNDLTDVSHERIEYLTSPEHTLTEALVHAAEARNRPVEDRRLELEQLTKPRNPVLDLRNKLGPTRGVAGKDVPPQAFAQLLSCTPTPRPSKHIGVPCHRVVA